MLDEVVRTTNRLRPDIVVLTGDVVEATVFQIRHALRPLMKLKTKYGIYFVTVKLYTVNPGYEIFILEGKDDDIAADPGRRKNKAPNQRIGCRSNKLVAEGMTDAKHRNVEVVAEGMTDAKHRNFEVVAEGLANTAKSRW
ncbi:predicted protein [Nematostella vectensis]|uniref:Uncharacterized protein n=1 Tax=Nematostella vectensis TaxID=45351 RepID=A7T8I5_NEMVE|nr:predicted protein [Nematostella vectensis]|eukprot:XP_001619801.1 hypothetical protein NEMVEDRAFT_v1g223809 [Nematostella vectensis]